MTTDFINPPVFSLKDIDGMEGTIHISVDPAVENGDYTCVMFQNKEGIRYVLDVRKEKKE